MAAEQILSHTGNDLLANGMLAGVLLLGAILTALIKADYRRQAASKPQGSLLKGIDDKTVFYPQNNGSMPTFMTLILRPFTSD